LKEGALMTPQQRCSIGALCLALLALAGANPALSQEGVRAKLDQGLDGDPDSVCPVFVRLTDQLISKGGDYEKFCRDHQGEPRSKLRRWVVQTLKEKADRSFKKIAGPIEKLREAGQVHDVERFWIVNGLACRASVKACRQLAGLEEVSFVYLQRGPVLQHAESPARGAAAQPGLSLDQQKQIYKQVLDQWKDDSNEPFSSEGLDIPWNLRRIRADAAWREEHVAGKGVVVALCDSGLMVAPPLLQALWKNPGEKLNGQDDDGNGYVDDLFGYDFAARSFYALGDSGPISHGSICAGIIAGRPEPKSRIITGVAPRARLMVLRGMGYLKSYEYALANGADVMSMSYMWPGVELGHYRGLFRTAHEHLAAGGLVAVGGAGNFSRLPQGKQIALPKDIPCVIAAAGILEDGSKAPPSSEGPCYWNGVKFYDDFPPEAALQKPDVTGCFGGYPMWYRVTGALRVPKAKVAVLEGTAFALVVGPQGNSFSGPHAAGVAALMLSANPEMNAWEVKSLMEQTCQDIGPKGRDLTFGAGLLNALEAVRAAKKTHK
jgi:subtilisin family serine protease